MKRLLPCLFALILVFTTVCALAADLTGEWVGDLDTGNGTVSLTYHLKQQGATLTGTVQGPQGDPLTIHNGKVDGDKITFAVEYNGTEITNTGTITSDTIKLTTQGGDFGPASLTLKRSNAPGAPSAPATPTPSGS